MARWLHKYELLIGSSIDTSKFQNKNGTFLVPINLDEFLQLGNSATTGSGQGQQVGSGSSDSAGNAYRITELNIKFSIVKSNSKKPNDCTLTIYNLSDSVVNYISENISNNVAVSLSAGYGELEDKSVADIKNIFRGTVVEILDKWDRETRETRLKLKDGAVNITEATSTTTFREGTPALTVITGLVNDLGLPIGSIVTDENVNLKPLVGNVSVMGNSAEILHRFTSERGLKFSVQDGKAYITPKGSSSSKMSAYISPASGLIGSPEPLSSKQGKSKSKAEPVNGIKFRCQLDGAIIPESTVYVESRYYNEAFKVTKVTHTGEYEGDEWITEVECSRTNVVSSDSTEE